MKAIISVSKTYIHRGVHRHRLETRKYWHIYYYDEEGNFQTERVNFLQALYYMKQKRHRRQLFCTNCRKIFLGLIKSMKEKIKCPYCGVVAMIK